MTMSKSLPRTICFLLLACSVLACGKVEQPKKSPYSEKQLKAFEVLIGTFVNTNAFVPSLKTTLVFSKHYDEPVKVEYKDGEEAIIHGEVRLIYYNGDSYDRYYRLHFNVDGITFLEKSSNYLGDYYSVKGIYDLEIKDANTFLIRSFDSNNWDKYVKQ